MQTEEMKRREKGGKREWRYKMKVEGATQHKGEEHTTVGNEKPCGGRSTRVKRQNWRRNRKGNRTRGRAGRTKVR